MYKLNLYLFTLIVFFLFECSGVHEKQIVDVAKVDSERIITSAKKYLNEQPRTVTEESCDRSAGGKHDFYSEGDYWWPNPEDPDGPYIRRDGQTNPDNFVAHRQFMWRLSIQVPTLVAAFKVTKDMKYAEHAIKHLMAWFVNAETKMNPNLLYAQAIKGKVTGRGIGIIDTIHLVEVARAIMILEKSGTINKDGLVAIKQWFSEYLQWMTNHKYGQKERDNGNNHSTCWTMQVAAFADLVGNEKQKQFCRDFYKSTLLPDQMATDGSFPKETKRTKPYNYSLFNLDAMIMVCKILSTEEDNLWYYTTKDGRSIKLAMEFMYPFIKDKNIWPFDPDVMYYEYWPVRHPSLIFAGLAFTEQKYIELWKTLEPDPNNEEVIRNFPIRQPILWVN